MRLGLVSLGCDKNTVDSERMLAWLTSRGAEPVSDLSGAEVILVNTCGFIDAAREESIETLLRAAEYKREGSCRSVVAVGCLVEQHGEELRDALPEVDTFIGLRDIDQLVPTLTEDGLLPPPAESGEGGTAHPGDRLPLGRRHVRYLKISEGCSHGCAFCAIPLWRGKHRSFPAGRVIAEARRLEQQGAAEVNLVAQDLAHWGREYRDGSDLTTLLEGLMENTAVPWYRLLYIYSAGLTPNLAELMACEPRLLPYIDMPIQHASDAVLGRMRRPERRDLLRRKVEWLRREVPGLVLRTTVLVGFPGETDVEFRELLDFLEETEFDHLGGFTFSPQQGTRAAAMTDATVPEDVARDRLEEVLELQRGVSADCLGRLEGKECVAIVDGPAGADDPVLEHLYPGGPPPGEHWSGRLAGQAFDIDGSAVLRAEPGFAAEARDLAPGTLVKAVVSQTADFDVACDLVGVVRAAPGSTRERALPVLGMDSVWGR